MAYLFGGTGDQPHIPPFSPYLFITAALPPPPKPTLIEVVQRRGMWHVPLHQPSPVTAPGDRTRLAYAAYAELHLIERKPREWMYWLETSLILPSDEYAHHTHTPIMPITIGARLFDNPDDLSAAMLALAPADEWHPFRNAAPRELDAPPTPLSRLQINLLRTIWGRLRHAAEDDSLGGAWLDPDDYGVITGILALLMEHPVPTAAEGERDRVAHLVKEAMSRHAEGAENWRVRFVLAHLLKDIEQPYTYPPEPKEKADE